MTSLEQAKFTFNCLLQDMKESWCCVFKVRQYICASFDEIHLAARKVEQKATSQHRNRNHWI